MEQKLLSKIRFERKNIPVSASHRESYMVFKPILMGKRWENVCANVFPGPMIGAIEDSSGKFFA